MAEPADNTRLDEARPTPDSPEADFRWQGLFQRTSEPLFVLRRRRRILFVNRAWEELTGLEARAVRGLACRLRARSADSAWPEIVTRALAPSPEAVGGEPAQVRRLVARNVH